MRLQLKLCLLAILASPFLLLSAWGQTPEQAVESLDWVEGPKNVRITGRAMLSLPAGYVYLNANDTATFMELLENIPGDDEYLIAPDDFSWFAVFSYEDVGNVKDDEEIDASAVMDSLKTGNRLANREREKRGWGTLNILGWQYPPFYEADTNRLSWATLAESQEGRVVNYNTRFLGRTGVMSATLVAEPEELDGFVPEFKSALLGFSFNSGQSYAEFRPGDKVAAFGLAGLIAGGAAAAAAKGAGKGIFKAIGIAIVAAFFGIVSFIKRLFRRG